MGSDELYLKVAHPEWCSDEIEPAGFTLADVRRLAEFARSHAREWSPRPEAVLPFLHLIDGGFDAP